MASGCNLWVWLQCIGVASRCCYKEVQSNLPYPDLQFTGTSLYRAGSTSAHAQVIISLGSHLGLRWRQNESVA